MFYDEFIYQCERIGRRPTAVASDVGISTGLPSLWKRDGLTPRSDTLNKLAEYFGVSVEVLLDHSKAGSGTVSEAPSVDFRDLYPSLPDGIVNRILYGSSVSASAVQAEKTKITAPDNSMIFDCIPKGAEIVCRKVENLRDGSLAAFRIDGDDIIRRVSVRGDEIILGASNPRYTPSCVKIEALSSGGNGVWGEVVSVSFTVS